MIVICSKFHPKVSFMLTNAVILVISAKNMLINDGMSYNLTSLTFYFHTSFI